MTEIIKGIIAKIKTKIMFSKCYNEMESKGIAVFGMCSGKWHKIDDLYKVPYKQCTICRHFRIVRSDTE